jgi:hypothetical protein
MNERKRNFFKLLSVAFALMLLALLAGCGSNGGSGAAGPAGPPGDAPTAEEVAEALLADDDAVDTLTGPTGPATTDDTTVDLLAMTPAERIMTSLGGTAPKGSKADVDKAQADIIANLKGTAAWNDNGIVAGGGGGIVKGAGLGAITTTATGATTYRVNTATNPPMLDVIPGKTTSRVIVKADDVGHELSRTDTVVNAGKDMAMSYNLSDLLKAINVNRAVGAKIEVGAGQTIAEAIADSTVDLAAVQTALGMDADGKYYFTVEVGEEDDVFAGDDETSLTTAVAARHAAAIMDNYPRGDATLTATNARTHLDTFALMPVVDVDGVSLVKFTIDSAHGMKDDAPITDGRYRLEAYGAWLSDSYFGLHKYTAVTNEGDLLTGATRKSTYSVHFAGGDPASLTGLNESATWTGAMVGHDTKAATADAMQLQGKAELNARIQTDTLQNPDEGGVAVVDVMFSNITDQTGMDARVAEMSWTGLELMDRYLADPAGFAKSDGEIEGWLFDDGNEIVGKFNHMDIIGAYGATLDDGMMMDDTQ